MQAVYPPKPTSWLDEQAEHVIVAKSVQAAEALIKTRSHEQPELFSRDSSLTKATGETLTAEERIRNTVEGILHQAIKDATTASKAPALGTMPEMPAIQVIGSGDQTALKLSNELEADIKSKRFAVVTELVPAVKEALQEGLRAAYTGVKAAQFAELKHRDESRLKATAHRLAPKHWLSEQTKQVVIDYSEKTLSQGLHKSGYTLPGEEVARLSGILKPALKSAIDQYSSNRGKDLIPDAPQGLMRPQQYKGHHQGRPTPPVNAAVERVLKGLAREPLAQRKTAASAMSIALLEAVGRLSDAKSFDKSQEVIQKR